MGMYGDRDNIVNPHQWQPLQEGVPHARIERFSKAGHFIMLDEPQTFHGKTESISWMTAGTNMSDKLDLVAVAKTACGADYARGGERDHW